MNIDNAVHAEENTPLHCYSYTMTQKNNMAYFHYHIGYEIYYLISGSVTANVGDKIYNLKKGNMLIIPPYVPHRNEYPVSGSSFRSVVNISGSYLSDNITEILESFKQTPMLFFSSYHQDTVSSYLKRLEKELSSDKPYANLLANAYLTELLIYIFRHSTPAGNDNPTQTLVHNVIKYINNHYQNNITTIELANLFHISESTILRQFRKYTRSGINEYINFIRILNAEKLLLETNLSITEIAFRCGFNDSNYFSTVFKKYKDLPPLKYAKKYKKTNNKEVNYGF